MDQIFRKKIVESKFLDASNGFEEKTVALEIRTDQFLNRVSRVVTFRMKFPEAFHDMDLVEKSRPNCPFCREHIESVTPKFPPSLYPKGRIHYGKSVVFPNAFPYSQYGSVTVFSDDHYLSPAQLVERPEILSDALKASRLYIDALRENTAGISYASINWNYMPGAGGGLIHPHLQTIASHRPTHFHQKLLEASSRYHAVNGKNFWEELIRHEKRLRERYLFDSGEIEFLSCFSPGGMFGEILAIFSGTTSCQQIDEHGWACFVQGLIRVIHALNALRLNNLNMTLFLAFDGDEHFRIQARIIPRLTLPPLGTSDINFFEKGHDEIIVTLSPEDLAEQIRGH